MIRDERKTITLTLDEEKFKTMSDALTNGGTPDAPHPDRKVFDLLTLKNVKPIPTEEITSFRVAKTKDGLETGEAFDFDPKTIQNVAITQTLEIDTNFWYDADAKTWTFIVNGRWVRFRAFDEQTGEPFTNAETALREVNARNARHGFASPFGKRSVCPECGRVFDVKRDGQIYDRRPCAVRAGARRRYAAQKLAGKESDG